MRPALPGLGRRTSVSPTRLRRQAMAIACVLWAVASLVPVRVAGAGGPGSARQRADGIGYKLGPGPWGVRTIDRLVLKDPRRHKNVEVTIRYPRVQGTRAPASWPLVVFSHGAGGSRSAFPDLTAHWASHGYVVIVPSHGDAPGRPSRHHQPRTPYYVDDVDRLADLVFVVDSLDDIEKKMDGFHGRHAAHVDRERIGVAGHAAGALTSQMAIGVKVRLADTAGETELKSVGDPRFRAAIVISGQGIVNRMLTRDSWTDLAKPLLVITGSRDVVSASRETPETRQEPFLLARPGQKFLVFIEGATHESYEGRPAGSALDGEQVSDADLRMITGVTASATLAFLDAFLDNDEHARDYLASDDLAKFSQGRAQVRRK